MLSTSSSLSSSLRPALYVWSGSLLLLIQECDVFLIHPPFCVFHLLHQWVSAQQRRLFKPHPFRRSVGLAQCHFSLQYPPSFYSQFFERFVVYTSPIYPPPYSLSNTPSSVCSFTEMALFTIRGDFHVTNTAAIF